ncbi:MAG TPA: Crp/Fnr family transcriptional regulator [Candidatus Binatia bacterium]|jgi:CRP-like cAMP-binding protein
MSWFHIFLTQESKSFAAGQVIFQSGDPAECMYVVADGEVEIAFDNGRVEVAGQEGILGEMALIDHQPRSATARARTACRLVEIPEKRFLYLVHETPHFALEVMRVLAERLRAHDKDLTAS